MEYAARAVERVVAMDELALLVVQAAAELPARGVCLPTSYATSWATRARE